MDVHRPHDVPESGPMTRRLSAPVTGVRSKGQPFGRSTCHVVARSANALSLASWAIVGLLAVLGPESSALAASAVILPRTGGSGVGPEARDRALEALRTVLVNDGFELFDPEAVSTRLPARLASCGPDDECAYELRAILDVDLVVGLRLWGTEDRVERLAVMVVGERGVGQRALGEVTPDRPLVFTVAEVARTAIALWETGDVVGAPEPPVVSDLEGRWVDAHLEPSPLNWFLGGLLILGSAPLLGYGINSAVLDGECVADGDPSRCTERIRFREGAAILTVMGATLLGGGLFTWIAQPLRVTVHADVESASLALSGTF